MNTLSSFPHPCVVPNSYDFCRTLKEKLVSVYITLFYIMKVNQDKWDYEKQYQIK